MTLIRNKRGCIERPWVGLAYLNRVVKQHHRCTSADFVEPESNCLWTAKDSMHGLGVDGGPIERGASDDRDCLPAPAETDKRNRAEGGAAMMLSFEAWNLEVAGCGTPMSVIAHRMGCSRHTQRRLMRYAIASLCDETSDGQAQTQEAADDLG